MVKSKAKTVTMLCARDVMQCAWCTDRGPLGLGRDYPTRVHFPVQMKPRMLHASFPPMGVRASVFPVTVHE